eukprot:TRINITY_DN4994_c0_g1_i1.p2 TRINITY_DN4994_c0_g1~~TRINITY_DN4994_c0_g1_i1.p2  ORF type:complete len:106 (+),score=10.43 TRINITY_DN4994_c0_g1_i1:1-318(+)
MELNRLPLELLLAVFSNFQDGYTIVQASRVCKLWRRMLRGSRFARTLWETLNLRDFGRAHCLLQSGIAGPAASYEQEDSDLWWARLWSASAPPILFFFAVLCFLD